MKTLNLAVYSFQTLSDLPGMQAKLLAQCEAHDLKGTILLAEEGINAFVAGEPIHVEEFEQFLRELLQRPALEGKRSWSETRPFKRLFVKIKSEIIPMGVPSVRPDRGQASVISPRELREWLDAGRDFTLLDTRNEFEVNIGTFNRALQLNIKSFREFPERAQSLASDTKEKPLVMFCTGGIRCEKAALLLEQAGFKEVLQLGGGILKYFEECGDAHFNGSCFVFDERVAVNGLLEPVPMDLAAEFRTSADMG